MSGTSNYKRRRELGLAFGEAVRARLRELGWHPRDLGRAMLGPGCTDRQAQARGFCYVNRSKCTCPTLETVERVAAALQCSPLDLLVWERDDDA